MSSAVSSTSLLAAVRTGQVEAVVEAVASGGSYAEREPDSGCTPFLLAATLGHVEIMKWLIDHGAPTTDLDKYDGSALLCAAATGQAAAVSYLLDHGIAAIDEHQDGTTALLFAAQANSVATIQSLLERGARIDDLDSVGDGILHRAALDNHVDVLRFVLGHHHDSHDQPTRRVIDINLCDPDGFTPLLIAISKGHTEAMEFLLERGADPTIGNGKVTPMTAATLSGSISFIQYLLDHHPALADMSPNEQGLTPFLAAVSDGRIDVAKWLIDTGKSHLAETDKSGGTAIHAAAFSGSAELIDYIVSKGFDINAASADNFTTPLMYAAWNSRPAAVRHILELGGDHTLRNSDGFGPASGAAVFGDVETIRILACYGADICEFDSNSAYNLIRLCETHGKDDLREWLEQTIEFTPLEFACEMRSRSDVLRLLREGEPVTGSNALKIASERLRGALAKPVDRKIVAIIRAAMQPWNPRNHLMRSDLERSYATSMFYTLLHSSTADMPSLPMEMVLHILSYIHTDTIPTYFHDSFTQ